MFTVELKNGKALTVNTEELLQLHEKKVEVVFVL